MPSLWKGRRARIVVVACTVLLVLGASWWVVGRSSNHRVTAYFGSTVGVYAGSDVRILGVPVGRVDEVLPQGERVRVTMSVDGEVAVPANAGAVVVSPSLVSDRYVQLTPIYRGGQRMGDGAVIPQQRTATPAEIDQLSSSLDELLVALGPSGANSRGELSDLLNTGAANLQGNGVALRDTIRRLGEAGKTLDGSEEDLFATVDQLQKFTSMLAANDGQVERINGQLADVASFLAGERDDLGGALHDLTDALGQVQEFVQDNRGQVKSNVDRLSGISQVLVDQRASLEEALGAAPGAFAHLRDAYNPETRTWDSRTNLNELSFGAARQLCKAPPGGPGASLSEFCAHASGSGARQVPASADRSGMPALPLRANEMYATPKEDGR